MGPWSNRGAGGHLDRTPRPPAKSGRLARVASRAGEPGARRGSLPMTRKRSPAAPRPPGRVVGFETLVVDLSSRLLATAPGDLDRALGDALRRLGAAFRLDLVALWRCPAEAQDRFTLTHVHPRLPRPGPPAALGVAEMLPWGSHEVAAEGPTWEVLRRRGIRSAFTFPLPVGTGSLGGALACCTTRGARHWTRSRIDRLRLVSLVIAHALARQRAEEVTQGREVRLGLALEAAGAGLWSLDLERSTVSMSPKMCEILPVAPPEEPSYERFLGAIHAEDREAFDRAVRHAARTGAPLIAEFRVVLPGGGLRWVAARGSGRNGLDAGRHVLIGVAIDVTDRKRSEAALSEAAERYATITRTTTDGVLEIDLDGRIVAANEACSAILGYGAEELLDMTIPALEADETPDEVRARIRRVASADHDRFETRHRRKDGATINVEVSTTYLPGSATILAFLRDVTPRKRITEELQRLRLHSWHADRVAQTGAITASLAHELNQPLAAILTNAQAGLRFMAREDLDVEEIRAILTDIVRDDKRAASVMHGLRAMLRRRETQRETVRLGDVVRTVLDLVHGEVLAHHVELRLDLGADPLVLANRAQIQQVVLNLVMNAVEAMQDTPFGERTLELTLTQPTAREALVAVRDSGPGIPEESRDKVFETFWTTKQEGLGVGLAISRSIIESHGGSLQFTPNPTGGMTFSFSLPLGGEARGTVG